MKKALIPALLLVLASVVLGATVFRAPLATAAGNIPSMLVANDKQHALPVEEQNLDADGNIKVHEQGTADVNVTNSGLPIAPPQPVTAGGGALGVTNCPLEADTGIGTITATALQIHWGSDVTGVTLRFEGHIVAGFWGPKVTGDPNPLVLSLTRPVAFDHVTCNGAGLFAFSWIGNEP